LKTLADLAQLVGGRIDGDPAREIDGVANLADAGPRDVAFIASSRYAAAAADSHAACLIVPDAWESPIAASGAAAAHADAPRTCSCGCSPAAPASSSAVAPALLRVADPSRAMVAIAAALCSPLPVPPPGVHPSAVVAPSAVLAEGVHVGACAVIGEHVKIGPRTRIRAGAVIADEATVGADCDIYYSAVLRERVRLGSRVIIHAGCVIGADGFGYLPTPTGPEKIPQLGTVEIGDDSELGACVTVDRARFGVTRIGRKVKIDNLVQIAHNVEVGDASVIVAQVAVAGSTRIGRGCVVGGQAAIDGHLVIGDGARIAAKAGVTKDVPPGAAVSGYPAQPHRDDLRHQAALRRIDEIFERLRAAESRLAAIAPEDRS
jgi:UDP-3-O-[3-hydroxymyristoyl] glucosamine N-acyltransferase